MKNVILPLKKETRKKLCAGDMVAVSGELYTVRDQAHKRLVSLLGAKKKIPIPAGASIYYCGPTPPPPGQVIGSCGPTTASRMDRFTPTLLQHGLTVMIGKGKRSEMVRKAIKSYGGLYLCTFGGCGALLQQCVSACECVAFDDLGPEAIYKLTITNFPAIVAIDCRGTSIF